MKKQVNEKKFNFKVTVICVAAAILLVLAALFCVKYELDSRKRDAEPVEESIFNTFKVTETGSVKTDLSKTKKYFDSHYGGDYSYIAQYQISSDENGEYYQTEEISYSQKGYKYKKVYMAEYGQSEAVESIAYLYTPDKKYLIYPSMQKYTEAENEAGSGDSVPTFENEEFTTGTVKVNGTQCYCETATLDGTVATYCFFNDDLKYVITETTGGSVLTTYISYSDKADYSLFEIPESYSSIYD